jgi:hypothetical protein
MQLLRRMRYEPIVQLTCIPKYNLFQVLSYLWESRNTWLAELQGALVPHLSMLTRETDGLELDSFFNIPEDKDITWRMRFLKKTDHEDVEPLVAAMKANATKGIALPPNLAGLTVLVGTSFNWEAIPSNSMKRDHTKIAQAAIVEERRWVTYRKKIVTQTSIAHFRSELCAKIAPHADVTFRDGKPVNEWSFVDGLVAKDLSKIEDIVPASFFDRLRVIEAQQDAAAYIKEITELIRYIEKRRCASLDGVVGPQLEENVASALAKLIEVRHHCPQAWRHRTHVQVRPFSTTRRGLFSGSRLGAHPNLTLVVTISKR